MDQKLGSFEPDPASMKERFAGDGSRGFSPDRVAPGAVWQQHQRAGSATELIKYGREIDDLLMRTVLDDVNEARDYALALAYCDEFGLEEEKQTFRRLMALKCSIKGKGRAEFTQALIGVVIPSFYGGKDDGNRSDNRRKLF